MRELTPRNAGGEPALVGRIADQQHGTVAASRHRIQNIVDPEVAGGLERDAGEVRIALGKRGGVGSQISVAKTLAPALLPTLPPASRRPRPSTLICPSSLTSPRSSRITQGSPGGWTPRTMFRFTTAAVAAGPGAEETGMTPIPPSN